MPAKQAMRASADQKTKFRYGVGARLTASFAVLALLPVAGGVIGILGTRPVHEPISAVAQATDRFGAHDRGFRESSRALNMLFAVPRNFGTSEAFDASLGQVERSIAGMRANLDALADSVSGPTGAALTEAYDAMEQALRQTLATTSRRIAATEQREQQVAAIVDAGERIAAAAALAAADATHDEDPRRRLDALGYHAVTLGVLARENATRQSGGAVADLRAGFAARLRGALAELAHLPERPYRRELGEMFETVFRLALDEGGLFDTMDRIVVLREQESAEQQAVRARGMQLVDSIGQLDRENDARVKELLYAADRALTRSSLMQLGIGVLATLIAFVIMIVVVRGSVLRRLGRLTRATQALTSGRLDEPVPCDGADELTELAGALEAFRHSALALRRSERTLKERSTALELANRELDQFAYVASHDLKAPMRAIDSLAGFLREDLGDDLPGDSQRHLDMMQGRIQRLEKLLDSLLEYSRAGRHRAPREVVDLRDLVEDAVDMVCPQGTQVLYHGDFGRVSTWKTPLEQVVRNLVDNAFKHSDDDGMVSVDCELRRDHVRIVVADNGPGIDPSYHERIFGMFQTLKPRDSVEGSGMGLAILKKLVDTYGGTIEVRSDPARAPGTEFVVCWPIDAALPCASAWQGRAERLAGTG